MDVLCIQDQPEYPLVYKAARPELRTKCMSLSECNRHPHFLPSLPYSPRVCGLAFHRGHNVVVFALYPPPPYSLCGPVDT